MTEAFKEILDIIESFEKPFDCTGVREAKLEMARMQEAMKEKDAKIESLQTKMAELEAQLRAAEQQLAEERSVGGRRVVHRRAC